MPFEQNVHINCPFDAEYAVLLRPLLFTIVYLRLEPRIAETTDSGQQRARAIEQLIQESKYSIHDLSRIAPLQPGEWPRLNMSYELGLDLGCRRFGPPPLTDKRCLILEKEPYRYQKVLSDIAGSDIEAHEEDPQTLIRKVRNWFFGQKLGKLPSPNRIWEDFNEFGATLTDITQNGKYAEEDVTEMPKSEFVFFAKDWMEGRSR